MPRPPKEVVLLVGLAGAGKSTFYANRFFRTHMRLNLDMLSNRNREARLFEACLKDKQACVVDNTNLTAGARAPFIALAKQYKFTVVVYQLLVDTAEAQRRNAQRSGDACVPAQVIEQMASRFEEPTPEEGIDVMYEVRTSAEDGVFTYDISRAWPED